MRQILVFSVEGVALAIPVEQAVEICKAGAIQPVPGMPHFIAGVLVLRSGVVPIIDMRGRFGLQRVAPSKKRRIVMVRFKGERNGLMVDAVEGIIKLKDEQIAPPPALFLGLKSEFIEGIYREGERVVIILRLNELLSAGEVITLEAARKFIQGNAA